jgi:hypothetical protein
VREWQLVGGQAVVRGWRLSFVGAASLFVGAKSLVGSFVGWGVSFMGGVVIGG